MYLENLTSDESNQIINDHLKSCEECTNYLNNAERDLPNDGSFNDEHKDEQKVIKGIQRRVNRITKI